MLLHDAIQPFYTSRIRAADLQRPFSDGFRHFFRREMKTRVEDSARILDGMRIWTTNEIPPPSGCTSSFGVARSKATPFLRSRCKRQIRLERDARSRLFTWCKIDPRLSWGWFVKIFNISSRFAFSRRFIFRIYWNSKVAFLTFPLNSAIFRRC